MEYGIEEGDLFYTVNDLDGFIKVMEDEECVEDLMISLAFGISSRELHLKELIQISRDNKVIPDDEIQKERDMLQNTYDELLKRGYKKPELEFVDE